MIVETTLSVAIAAVAAFAALVDIRERRIPNWCCGVIAVLALAGVLMTGGMAGALGAVGVATAALAVGVLVYALGLVGAGDAKLLAALSLWIGASQFPAFLGILALVTLVLAVWSIATRGARVAVGAGGLAALPKRATIPLGLAISTAAIMAVFIA